MTTYIIYMLIPNRQAQNTLKNKFMTETNEKKVTARSQSFHFILGGRQPRSQGPLLPVPWSEREREGEDPGNKVGL